LNIEKTIARLLNIAGLVMAVVFVFGIMLNFAGMKSGDSVIQLGICLAIAIPVLGVIAIMILLFKKGETKYGICAIILLILLAFTTVWRLMV